MSGDFEGALKSNPNSIIRDAIHYALGHTIIEGVLNDAFGIVKEREKPQAKPTTKDTADGQNADEAMEFTGVLQYLKANADLYDAKPRQIRTALRRAGLLARPTLRRYWRIRQPTTLTTPLFSSVGLLTTRANLRKRCLIFRKPPSSATAIIRLRR